MNHNSGRPIYIANFENINFLGLLDCHWADGKIVNVLIFEGFSFGIFGNAVICKMEEFSKMAKNIANIKKEYYRGNKLPWMTFAKENFYIKT